MFSTRKGFGMTDILAVFISVIVFGAIYPVLSDMLDSVSMADPAAEALKDMIPFFMILAIIVGIVWHAIPAREVQ